MSSEKDLAQALQGQQLKHLCTICGCKVASKSKLFRHLETNHGFIGPSTKPVKVVLVIGWMSNKVDDEVDEWNKEESYGASIGILPPPDDVEQALFQALRSMNELVTGSSKDSDNPYLGGVTLFADGEIRPRAFGRASRSCNTSSIMVGPDITASGVCDVVSFHGRPLVPPMTDEVWVEAINRILPSSIQVLRRLTLPPDEFEFSAEAACTHRVYEYMIPLDILMPPGELVGTSEGDNIDNSDNADNIYKSTYNSNIFNHVSDDDDDEEEGESNNQEEESKATGGGSIEAPVGTDKSQDKREKRKGGDTFVVKLLDSSANADQIFSRSAKLSIQRILYFRKLKRLLLHFGKFGRASYHNYAKGGLNGDDSQCRRRIDRIYHKELVAFPSTYKGAQLCENSEDSNNSNNNSDLDSISISNSNSSSSSTTWAVISISGDDFLRSQARKLLAISLAVMRGWLPLEFIEGSLDPKSTMCLPAVPGAGLFYSESKFTIWESKHVNKEVIKSRFIIPRGVEATYSSVIEHIAQDDHEKERKDENSSENGSETKKKLTTKTDPATQLKLNLPASVSSKSNNDEVKDPSVVRINEWRLKLKQHVAQQMSSVGFKWVDKLRLDCIEYTRQFNRMKELQARDLASVASQEALLNLPITSPCPKVFENVLRLLREADKSGMWPDTSLNRKRVIADESIKENIGGSFSVGAFPSHLAQPKGNRLFTELTRACFELERALMPHRPPSGTIAINRHAQFKPHRDSGAGNGQSMSLIVALGDFIGGEIVVEANATDIRYKAIEFDGWTERHWTLPFSGERYSLVWFTPAGVTDSDMWWWKENGVPQAISASGGGSGKGEELEAGLAESSEDKY